MTNNSMLQDHPLFPARLHHLCLSGRDVGAMTGFYRDGLGLSPAPLPGGSWLMSGGQRSLVFEPGEQQRLVYSAYAVAGGEQLDALRGRLAQRGIRIGASPSPLFRDGAFSVSDPDGGLVVFGMPKHPSTTSDRLPGRLQHVVKRSAQLDRVVAFYRDGLGFRLSDVVFKTPGAATACFLRSDPEHHSFAVFDAKEPAFDHFSLESPCWNDLRDWADHFARLNVPLYWGPGRHGPGNNLFFMVRDPEGNAVEISAEIETITDGRPAGEWQHSERTLNLWGGAWMRS